MRKKIVLGAEWDDHLRERLDAALKARSATFSNASWTLGGSQVIDSVDARIGEEVIRVEAETYIGLWIEGPAAIVDALAKGMLET